MAAHLGWSTAKVLCDDAGKGRSFWDVEKAILKRAGSSWWTYISSRARGLVLSGIRLPSTKGHDKMQVCTRGGRDSH